MCNKNPRAIIDAKQSSAKITKCQFCTEKNKSASLPTRPIPPAIKPSCMAAKAGATYVSPFIGRIDDTGADGMALIAEIMATWENYNVSTKVLAASIRHPTHVLACMQLGAHTVTMPTKTFRQLMSHPLTDKGLDGFMKDWADVEAAGNA